MPTLFRVTATLDVVAAAVGTPTARRARSFTKTALMPVLGFSALRRGPGTRSRGAGTAAVGLGLSWCGDVALLRTDENAFVVGLGAFLGGHLAYGAGFGAAGGVDGLRNNPLLAVPALAVAGAGAAALLPVAGSLRAPVAGYIGVITAMTALAIGTRRPTAIAGAALFCASDLLLGLSRFRTLPFPQSVVDAVVTLTYCAAQELIVRSLLESPGNG